MMKGITYHVFFILLLLITGCAGMKNITSADPLYVGHGISISGKGADKAQLMSVVNGLIRPEPNNKTLWMRPAIARNNMLSDSAKTKKFWRTKIAEPVLFSQADPQNIIKTIEDRMFHNGFFRSTASFDTVRIGKRKAKYKYSIVLNKPYEIESVIFPNPIDGLSKVINESSTESLLIPGDIYTLDNVKKERNRIDLDLKENGYIYFSPDFLLLRADSVSGENKINALVTVNSLIPPESKVPYKIGKIFIHDDKVLENDLADTVKQEDYYLISQGKEVKMKTLLQGMFLKPGDLYSRSDYLATLRHFNNLPIIRNANMKFLPKEGKDEMDVLLYLSHKKRFAYSAEFNTVFRSTNYFGPGIVFSYTDRNANKGSELLKVNLRGSFEMQIVENDFNLAYELGFGVEYTLPRFFPRVFANSVKKSLPKTTISVGYTLFNRVDLYRLNSVVTNFGYKWGKDDRMHHYFYPLEVIFTSLPENSKSQKFKEYLEENPGVQRSFDEQFVFGMGYELTYQTTSKSKNNFFFRGGIDAAGNGLQLIYSSANAPKDSLGRYTLFGVPFSQYIRPRIDIRNDFTINQHSNLVARFSTGVGIPFGNSTIIPYIKQFYVGGTNSLRSFVARSVGPGSEIPPSGYNDVTGDIRLEASLEYRFTLAGNLKGALFVDAGNIWLFREDPARPDGHFRFDSFTKQIAVSTGWGLRWDFEFIIVRFDFGYTIRTPYLPEGERWATGINFWKPAINFAIGYPF